ncbi:MULTISPECIES: iron-containing redox enzyme family protein [unclassified Pseudomonas]|uniref:iron-containing redox enzyme family protein n=1 Tax=unclassified Pseudomonas TaxID=196821 RepID=UPI002B221C7B|nr:MULTISPECIES: iron-containing redox enzyme family protein [unclassified Pseudomonas]MEA9977282.1 iron-containing redox enzyme family protein [Pseudomonas sp. RTS4]MEB0198225.1 iron-containing redox enzyme family protein [Pseudomonas sp. 5S4]MEB0247079.1 iron-containing redox enzyme family protein [Pseudomonas sp. 10S5]
MNQTTLEAQQQIADYYRSFLGDPAGLIEKQATIRLDREAVECIEDAWNKQEESLVDVENLPLNKEDFLSWYLLYEKKINEDIRFFVDFMRHDATAEQVAYYICMEEMVDGSFDDLMAVTQVGMPIGCKMVAGENYWDEMGNGNFELVHTTMFKTSSLYMRGLLEKTEVALETPPIECLMNGNILLMWAVRREYNVRLIGAMGLVEGSAPVRFGATTAAMERLHLPNKVIAYHKAHISIDTRHSAAWYKTVLQHYSNCGESVIRELSLGVIVRYNVALRYYKHMYEVMRRI